MKQIIIIPEFHSMIDVITNSSTEIFIADTDKSVDAIEEYLAGLSQYAGCASDCGVGEIIAITEENVVEFVKTNHYYLDSFTITPALDIDAFEVRYYKNKGWNIDEWNEIGELERETYKKHSKEAYEAYNAYVAKFVETHMSEYKKNLIGKTILIGSSDNSIPYEIWEILNSQLNARNIHLG